MSTKIEHTSYTEKAGYVWRKRFASKTLSIALQTSEYGEALPRAAAMSIRFIELSSAGVPFEAMHLTMKAFRDEHVKQFKLARFSAIRDGLNATSTFTFSPEAPQEPVSIQPTQSPTFDDKIAHAALQRELATVAGHSLDEATAAYNLFNKEWKEGTRKSALRILDRFTVFCAASGIRTIEEVNKESVIAFKEYLDAKEFTPATKQETLTKVSSMFKYMIDVKEWIVKNPFNGMSYKNVKVVNKKEEITPAQYETVMGLPQVANNNQAFWCMAILFNTGMRIDECSQLTKADYVEIEGIKCISVNDENGKRIKNESSIRNIPINDKLLEMGIWEKKPVFNKSADSLKMLIAGSFKLISLKRSSHCFRLSLSNRLRDAEGVEDSTRNFILGHTNSTITDRIYVSRLPLIKMQAALNLAC